MSREELIEKLREVIAAQTVAYPTISQAEAIYEAVFEKAHTPNYADSATVMEAATKIAGENAELMERLAHTPSSDEREALARIILELRCESRGIDPAKWIDQDSIDHIGKPEADRILAAGFRRTVQDEPTDAQVKAGAYVLDECAMDAPEDYPLAYEAAMSTSADILRAAFAVTGREGEGRD